MVWLRYLAMSAAAVALTSAAASAQEIPDSCGTGLAAKLAQGARPTLELPFTNDQFFAIFASGC